jgi:hypothetical protein
MLINNTEITQSSGNIFSLVSRTGRGARIGTRAGRIVRIVRLLRIIRVGKLIKHTNEAINHLENNNFESQK